MQLVTPAGQTSREQVTRLDDQFCSRSLNPHIARPLRRTSEPIQRIWRKILHEICFHKVSIVRAPFKTNRKRCTRNQQLHFPVARTCLTFCVGFQRSQGSSPLCGSSMGGWRMEMQRSPFCGKKNHLNIPRRPNVSNT